jgi:hypothetical protein
VITTRSAELPAASSEPTPTRTATADSEASTGACRTDFRTGVVTAPTHQHHPHEGPLRVLVGKERFSENHAWSEMPRHWPGTAPKSSCTDETSPTARPVVDAITEAVGATTIMARGAQPDEIANVTVFLAPHPRQLHHLRGHRRRRRPHRHLTTAPHQPPAQFNPSSRSKPR